MPGDTNSDFRDDVVRGLSQPQKAVPGKYIWDARGSAIFDAITQGASYYPTALEEQLLEEAAPAVARCVGSGASVVEFGSGASRKIRLLLEAVKPVRYIALDISSDFAESALRELRSSFPDLDAVHVYADYLQSLPPLPLDGSHGVLGFLPGTSIGNMVPADAAAFLRRIRASLGASWFLVGHDINRDPARLAAAYGSPLMADLHTNLLRRLQEELGATLEPGLFRHEARLPTDPPRAEAHLVAQADTAITLGDRTFAVMMGESIITDLSWKYGPEEFRELARECGWAAETWWTDSKACFCLDLLRSV